MTFNEYQILAMRTAAPDRNMTEMLTEAAMGLAGECGEVADLIKKSVFQDHRLSREALIRELGDVLWYLNLATSAIGYGLNVVAAENIRKLEKRYPDGFDPERV